MDRYEYKLKFDEMKSLVAEGKYDSALQIADSVNWKRVNNMGALMMAADIYEKADRFDESIDLLLLAYDRSPIGKKVVYKLAEIAVKTGNIESAEDYYREFVEIAPHDTDKYILALKISRAKGESINSQIRILEDLRDQEYTEEWTYELAYLYHKAGEVSKCVKTCDELILWFGDGEYVEKALELKLIYQPLNPDQEAKYKALKEKKDGIKELKAPERLDASKFDTANLTDEIARGVRGILDATEKEQVSESISSIKKLVDDIPYLSRAAREYKLPKQEEIYIETDAEIDDRMKRNFEEILKEENDGQFSMEVPVSTGKVPQITGQLDIEDILNEWERTKAAAERTIAIAETEKLSAAKQRAMLEAGNIVDTLSEILPDAISAGDILDRAQDPNFAVSAEPEARTPSLSDTRELEDLSQLFRMPREETEEELEKALDDKIRDDLEQAAALKSEVRAEEAAYYEIDDADNIQAVSQTAAEDDAAEEISDRIDDHVAAWEKIKQEMGGSSLIEVEQVETADEALLEELRNADAMNLNFDEEPVEEAVARTAMEEIPEEVTEGVQEETVQEEVQEAVPGEVLTAVQDEVQNEVQNEVLNEIPNEKPKDLPDEVPKKAETEAPQEVKEEPVSDIRKDLQKELTAEIQKEAQEELHKNAASSENRNDQQAPAPIIMDYDKSGANEAPEAKKEQEALIRQETTSIDIMPVSAETTQLPKLDLSPEIFEPMEETRKKKKNKRTTVAQTTASLMSGHITELDDDLRGIFTYFLNVEGIEQQIINVLDGTGKALMYRESGVTGNILITGISGSGKTTLGTDLAKALHAMIKRPGKKVGKIAAQSLGQKDLKELVARIAPGCLIVEKTDGMTMETAKKLAEYIPTVHDETLFILEGTSQAIKRVFSMVPALEPMFDQRIIIPNFSTDELVSFAKTYAAENGYSIDELAVLALYRRINNVEKVGKATCLLQVKDIMDEAFARVEKRGFKKAIGILTSRRYDKENYVIIREKDLG